MVGDVAAAVDLVNLDATLDEETVGGEDVGATSVAPERQDGWMLEEDQCVADSAGFACRNNLILNAQSFSVRDTAEIEQMHVHGKQVHESPAHGRARVWLD